MIDHREFQRLRRQEPFAPFRIHQREGDAIDVLVGESFVVGRQFVIVGLPRIGSDDPMIDRWVLVWYTHITRIEDLSAGSPFVERTD